RQLDASHHESRPQDRQIEALAVERHEHRRCPDAFGDPREDGGLFSEAPNEELLDDEGRWTFPTAFEPSEPDEKGDRTGARAEAGRLRVEIEGARWIARSESRIEGEQSEQLRARAARGSDGNPTHPMLTAVMDGPHVERSGWSVLDAKGKL